MHHSKMMFKRKKIPNETSNIKTRERRRNKEIRKGNGNKMSFSFELHIFFSTLNVK